LKNSFKSNSDLEFKIDIGNEKNYFVQSGNGAFHIILSKDPKQRCILASPAGNSGCMFFFEGNSEPVLIEKPKILSSEKVSFTISLPTPSIITSTVLGSMRTVRGYTEGGISGMKETILKCMDRVSVDSDNYSKWNKWLHPEWEISGDRKSGQLNIQALDGANWYKLELRSEEEIFLLKKSIKSQVCVDDQIEISSGKVTVTYSSSFKPLMPFTLAELLNKKALDIIEKHKSSNITDLLNGLRFLSYKEKFLAGSWRFSTYFGRDTILALRILMPILTPLAIETGFRAISERLNDVGFVSHEEDLSDQAVIDQLNESLTGNEDLNVDRNYQEIINNYTMVDSNLLPLQLLSDYYHIGGRNLFKPSSNEYIAILRNINFALKTAIKAQLIPILEGRNEGDWRDSGSGLGFGIYSFSVNAAIMPGALQALTDLLDNNVWDLSELKSSVVKFEFKYFGQILDDRKVLENIRIFWMDMWKKFHVETSEDCRNQFLNKHREALKFSNLSGETPYSDGFLALSLDENKKPVPIIQSDTLFMFLDFPINEFCKWFKPAISPFQVKLPDGLMSEAGILVATSALAGTKYEKMFDKNMYHGELTWAWPQLMLKVALLKQLGKWAIPSPSNKLDEVCKNELTEVLNQISELLIKLRSYSTSELWTWELDTSGNPTPIAYGQDSGHATESNAVQLWSVAALGIEVWDLMRKESK